MRGGLRIVVVDAGGSGKTTVTRGIARAVRNSRNERHLAARLNADA